MDWPLPTIARVPRPLVCFLLLAALVLPPLFAGLGESDCEYHMEVRTLAAAQETWMRQAENPSAWLVPSWNGEPRVNKPPLTVWIGMLLWSDLDPQSADVDVLVYRYRLFAVALTFLALLGIAWMGRAIGDSDTGWLAALITGTALLFMRFVRMASYDTLLLAFATMAVCAAIAAMHATSRRSALLRWTASGIALGLAAMTKGPVAYAIAWVPVAAIALASPSRWKHLAGALGAAAISAALVLPWYTTAISRVPHASDLMAREVIDAKNRAAPPWYYLGIIGLIFPWTLWLLVSLVHGAKRSASPQLRSALIWFAAVFVVLSLPGGKQQRYLLPILPAAGLLIATCIRDLERNDRRPKRLMVAHASLLLLASVLYGAFGVAQHRLLDVGILKGIEIARVPPWVFLITAALLALLARRALFRRRKGDAWLAALVTAAWISIAATPAMYGYVRGFRSVYRERPQVESVTRILGDAPVFHLLFDGPPGWRQQPDGKFLLYSRRQAPLVHIEDIPALPPNAFLLVLDDHPPLDRLRAAGWEVVTRFEDSRDGRILLKRRAAATEDSRTS